MSIDILRHGKQYRDCSERSPHERSDMRVASTRMSLCSCGLRLLRPGLGPSSRDLIYIKRRLAICRLYACVEEEALMRKLVFGVALALTVSSPAAYAQLSIDMARVTCAEYLAMPAARSAEFSAWMSGWTNQKTGYVFVDLNAYARNVANVKSWCASNPNDTVMAGLQRAVAR